MSEPNIQKLIEINEKIIGLEAVKCRITHEKVTVESETDLPFTKYIGEKVYERIGFCDEELRNKRISCSHTNAPEILHDALNLLDPDNETVNTLRNDLMDVIFQIHQLDHLKSDAEKDLAILIEQKIQQSDEESETYIKLAKENIEHIENKHDRCVDKIEKVRDQIVIELQLAIKTCKG